MNARKHATKALVCHIDALIPSQPSLSQPVQVKLGAAGETTATVSNLELVVCPLYRHFHYPAHRRPSNNEDLSTLLESTRDRLEILEDGEQVPAA